MLYAISGSGLILLKPGIFFLDQLLVLIFRRKVVMNADKAAQGKKLWNVKLAQIDLSDFSKTFK